MNYAPNVAVVTTQPQKYDIHCNFNMLPGERLLYHSKMETGCCKLGNIYYTSVTDTRYVSRMEVCLCCACCCKKPYIDKCIYLRDVGALFEESGDNGCCCECCSCLCCCRFMTPKHLALHGAWGTEIIHIYGKDIPDFELMISEAIAQHKLPDKQ